MKLVLLLILIFFAGCSLLTPPPAVENISEISLKVQTGLIGSDATISFSGDGRARCECTFYNLDKNKKPNLDFVKNICAELYQKNKAAFIEEKQSYGGVHLKGIFSGKITASQFENLAQTVRQSGFFLIDDIKTDNVRLDVPPNIVKVNYEGKTKEVSNANHDLSKIESEISRLAKETNWQ